MKHDELITKISQFFDIRELVSERVWKKHTTGAWSLFDPRLLETLLCLRTEILRVPLVCNNWRSGGALQQRGYRENTCEIVAKKTLNGDLYTSAHTLGMAVDLSSGQMSADAMRNAIIEHADKLPYKVRIESKKGAPTWLHIDVKCSHLQKEKVFIFD